MFLPSPFIFGWHEIAVTFLVKLTRERLLPVRAAWWCDRISTRRHSKPGQPARFCFWGLGRRASDFGRRALAFLARHRLSSFARPDGWGQPSLR